MKKFLGLAAIIAALGFLFAAVGCSNASDSSNAPKQTPAPTELEIPLTLEAIEDGEITLTTPWSTLKYKKNDGEFQTVNATQADSSSPLVGTITVAAGDKIALYADGSENDIDNGKVMMIQAQKDCYIYGNIMSLIDSSDYKSKTALNDRAAFATLFRRNKTIKNHSEKKLILPATTLTYACYAGMFEGCSALTSAPELPAATLAAGCYSSMFSSCEALTNAPALPATTLAQSCYISMFSRCANLTAAPALPATTLAQSCYNSMFYMCSNLTTAPALPATTLASRCYTGMFMACYKLQNAPELPAKELKEGCYECMFMDCTSLNYIKCLAESGITTDNTYNWTKNAASDGTFIKANGANWPTGANGIPTNWTVQTAVPEYNISTSGISNGTVTASVNSTNASTAEANATVTLTASPATGYQLSSIAVTKASGEAVTTSGDGLTRTFTMPAENVSVSATFTAINYTITTSGIANGTVTAKNSSGQAITNATYGQTVTLVIAAANYYEYTVDSISVTGVSNLGGSGLTRTFTMPAQNVTVSATFFTGPTVAATETKELGDIVLDNGLVVRYADRDKMTASQKSAAVAIIFDAANKKGVGVKITSENEKKKWCSDGAGLYNTNEYTQSKDDGAVNKSNAHPHMVVWSADAYPAFWFAEMDNRKGIFNDDNWYLPAENELKTLFTNKESVNNSFDALGITTEIVDDYWFWSSSSTTTFSENSAIFVNPKDGGGGGISKTFELRACSVRKF